MALTGQEQLYVSSGGNGTPVTVDAVANYAAIDIPVLSGVVAGTVSASKAIVVGTTKNIDTLVIADGGLKLGAGSGTAVTATAAELNYVDLVTLGTGAASKAVVLDSAGDYTYPATGTIVFPSGATETFASGATLNVAGTLQVGGVTVTSSAAELNYVDIASLGTGAASKAVVLDASGDYTYPAAATIVMPSGGTETFSAGSTLNVAGTFQIGGVTLGSTAAEIDAVCDVSAYQETIIAAGALTLGKKVSNLALVGAGAVTLAAPTSAEQGLTKSIVMTVDNGDVTLSLANVQGGTAATTCTWANVNETLVLVAAGAKWTVVGQGGVVLS